MTLLRNPDKFIIPKLKFTKKKYDKNNSDAPFQTTKIIKLGVEMLFKEKYPELQDVEYKMGITKG